MVVTSGKSSPSKSIPRERKKRFSSKVRTGCVNCKARRIKCPEEKPECFSCLKTGVLCVYVTRETKTVFHPKQALPQAQSCFHVFEVESKTNQRRFDIELVKPKSGAELRTVANVYQTLCRLQPSDIPFDAPSDKAAFGFWVTCTGPMFNSYHSGMEFYSTIAPQFAWQSRAVREVLIAVVHLDQKWHQTMRKTSDDSTRLALGHYHKALQDIQEGRTSKVETLVAALVAFTFSSMLLHPKDAQVHVQGARRIIDELQHEALGSGNHSMHYFVHNNVRPVLLADEAWLAFVTASRPDTEDNQSLARIGRGTYKALHNQMTGYMARDYRFRSGNSDLHGFLEGWKKAVRGYQNNGQEPLVLQEAMRLLFIIAMTLAPGHEERSTKHGDRAKAFEYIVTRLVIMLNMKCDLGQEDSEMLDETLKIVMANLFKFFPEEKEWWSRKDLIEKVAQEDHHVFEKTTVLERMNISHGASSGPPVNEIR